MFRKYYNTSNDFSYKTQIQLTKSIGTRFILLLWIYCSNLYRRSYLYLN